MGRQSIITESAYNGYAIQNQNSQGCIAGIIEGFEGRLKYMIDNRSQVSAMHLVLTWPDNVPFTDANQIVGYVLNALGRKLKYHGILSASGWVREISPDRMDDKPHFHIGLLADGHKIQNAYSITDYLNLLFAKQLGLSEGSVYVKSASPKIDCQSEHNQPSPTVIKLRPQKPGAAEQYLNIMNWFSYLAKADTKDRTGIRSFGFSLLS